MVNCSANVTNTFLFSECIAKGSRFTLGVWGLGRVSSMLLSRSQPSATVRDDCAMAMPMESAARVITFGYF